MKKPESVVKKILFSLIIVLSIGLLGPVVYAAVMGDANNDGKVTLTDFEVWRTAYIGNVQPTPGQPTPDPTAGPNPTSTPTGTICGVAGYEGTPSNLTAFKSAYPNQWRSDYNYAEPYQTPGETYENFSLASNLFVKSDNLVIRNFLVTPGSDYYVIRTDDREAGAGTLITNGTIKASGATNDSLIKGIVAAVDNLTISDMDISGTHDGISISSANVVVDTVCIHNLGTAPTAHNDGIEIYGGNHITIRNAEIHNQNGQTSAINITNDYGAINDVTIENSILSGGGYTIYVRGDGASGKAITNIRFKNVVIQEAGTYGVVSYEGAPGAIVEWDVKDAQGNAIPKP